MQVRKWLISGEINYNVCRICSLTLLPPGSTHPDSDHAECLLARAMDGHISAAAPLGLADQLPLRWL